MKVRLVAALVLAGALLLVPSALGWGPFTPAGQQCGSPPCWTEFTVDGGAPPSGVTLAVQPAGALMQATITRSGSNELDPSLTTASAVHMKLDVGTYDPAVVITTGLASAISTNTSDASHHTITIDAKPSASSWKFSGCTTGGCGDATTKADVDFKSLLLVNVTDLAGSPPDWTGPMHGAWISLNAEAFSFPIFNASSNSVSFSVASPHLKADGVTPQTGFFKFFIPDAMLVKMGYADPSTVQQGSVTVTRSDGVSVTFKVTYDSALHGVFLEAGTGGALPPWPYSAPTFTVTPKVTRTLTVTKGGGGTGTVVSNPAGIDCGSTCSHGFDDGTSVTLTATAAVGSSFTGWSGDCSGTGTCSLTMSAAHSATATFETDKTLTVATAGSGSGSITSSPAGIDCGSTCSHAFAHGTSVTLTATAGSGSSFTGWSGDCSGTGTCSLTMNAAHSATATFAPSSNPPPPPPPVKCVVPNVKRKTLAAATSAIKAAHCSLGKVQKATSTKKKGTVIAQNPPPGKKLAKGGKVNVVLSRGKK